MYHEGCIITLALADVDYAGFLVMFKLTTADCSTLKTLPFPLPQVLPQAVDGDSFPHVAMVTTEKDVSKKGVSSFLTKGKKEIASLLAIRHHSTAGHLLFYISTLEGEAGARQRHLFVVDTQTKEEKCLSCDKKIGKGCKYVSASLFEDSQKKQEDDVFFVLTCLDDSVVFPTTDSSSSSSSSSTTPFTATFQYKHSAGVSKQLKMLEPNAGYKEKMDKFSWPTKKFFKAPIRTDDSDDGLNIHGQIFLPKFSHEKYGQNKKVAAGKKKKHPVLVHIYSGPSTTKVNDRLVLDWHMHMATAQG